MVRPTEIIVPDIKTWEGQQENRSFTAPSHSRNSTRRRIEPGDCGRSGLALRGIHQARCFPKAFVFKSPKSAKPNVENRAFARVPWANVQWGF
jgi:hypothetical protein